MKKMNNLHDKFVRASFSDPNRAIAFFEKFLPDFLQDELNLNTLKPMQESYIQLDLNEHFSDIIFEVSSKTNPEIKADIVLLFEHKSSPDRNVLIQVGHYMFSHWFRCVREKKDLKIIIPIIYYQGQKKWHLPGLQALFSNTSVAFNRFIPELKHIFIALSSLSDDSIIRIRDKMMAAAVFAQKRGFNKMKFIKDLNKIFRLFPEQYHDRNFLESIFVYILSISDVPESELIKALEAIPPDIKENIMTTYLRIKEAGEQIGIQKGKLEGKLEGELIGIQKEKTEVILKGFDNGLKISLLSNITELSEEEVQKILIKNNRIKG